MWNKNVNIIHDAETHLKDAGAEAASKRNEPANKLWPVELPLSEIQKIITKISAA